MEWIELGKILKQIRGITYEKKDAINESKEGYTPIIRANNIQDFKFDYSELLYINSNKIKNEQIIKKDDIIIATSSGSKKIVGKAVQASENMNFSFGAFCKLIRITSTKVNSKYVGYYFNSDFYRNTISSLAEGANINNIRNEHINNLAIPVPAMEIQEKIVEVLDEAQALIDKRKEQIQLLDSLIESTFYTMFGDPVKNEKGWERGTIRDLAKYTQYGSSKRASDNGKYPMLRMGNITYEGNWDLKDLKYIDLNVKEEEKFLVKKGDLLFNRTNSRELVGKTAVYKEDYPMAFAGYLIKLETNSKANTEYISAYLNSKHGKLLLKNLARNIVGMANINAQELQDIKILIPPINLQNEFAGKVEVIEKQKKLLEKSLELLEENYKSIMDKAFKGQLWKV